MPVVSPPPLFEATHTERTSAAPSAIWALWADPARWADWNEQIQHAELDRETLQVGAQARIKFKRGGTVKFEVTAVEPERLFVDEARFPGARVGHEHRLSPAGGGCEITHRLYVEGPLSGVWSRMLGRKRMRESVARFTDRERELAEPKAQPPAKKRPGRGRR